MHPKKNLDIRAWIVGHGLTYGQVAKEMPMSKSAFSQMLQRELDKSEKDEIIQSAKRALLKQERGIRDEESDFESWKKKIQTDGHFS